MNMQSIKKCSGRGLLTEQLPNLCIHTAVIASIEHLIVYGAMVCPDNLFIF